MGKGYLLDTNIVIYYLGGILPEKAHQFVESVLQSPANISIISKIELLSWARLSPQHVNTLNQFIQASTIIGLDDPIVNQTIFIRKYFKKVKLPDAIIAASCIHYHYTLITRNVADFTLIDNLNSINPFDL